ncbi:MAG TPA: alcohol dehydrogenase catalytic domain-containing protein [Pseudonocardiaceae bacterium]|nr:alcohol dehydrogenase catalytic domain-containing protein [Pseudonocardiaceae bacterium]
MGDRAGFLSGTRTLSTYTGSEVVDPKPAYGQVSVRLETSGICHTDIHAAHGDRPVRPAPPLIPGHEGIGIVAAIGGGVDGR